MGYFVELNKTIRDIKLLVSPCTSLFSVYLCSNTVYPVLHNTFPDSMFELSIYL